MGVALEDFGLSNEVLAARARRRERRAERRSATAAVEAPAVVAVEPASIVPAAAVPSVAPVSAGCAERRIQVVWQGAAARRPELQRFCDHLESQRASAV